VFDAETRGLQYRGSLVCVALGGMGAGIVASAAGAGRGGGLPLFALGLAAMVATVVGASMLVRRAGTDSGMGEPGR
jgi:hypothetical protein